MGKKNKKEKKKKRKGESESSASSPKTLDLRKVELPPRPKPLKPADIRSLREDLNASQALFARLLNVSSNAVESWEQGIREPRQATLKLLHIARKNPGILRNEPSGEPGLNAARKRRSTAGRTFTRRGEQR
jgi:DNA-binding transcriptional regulator YiaG